MPATPRGLPYPANTDKVGQLPAQMQALAEKLDTLLAPTKVGTAVVSTVGGTTASVAVDFPTPFPAAVPVPTVVATAVTSNAEIVRATVVAVTRAGFTLCVYRTTGGPGNTSTNWIAIAQ